jgi:hypothetical protein
LNKLLFVTVSAAILYSAVAASAQGLPFMLRSTSDQPSNINQLPSRDQSADQPSNINQLPSGDQSADKADPGDPQQGRSAESRDSGLATWRHGRTPEKVSKAALKI